MSHESQETRFGARIEQTTGRASDTNRAGCERVRRSGQAASSGWTGARYRSIE